MSSKYETCHGKTSNVVSEQGDTNQAVQAQKKTSDFGFKKKRNCIICIVKTKVLISFAVTAKLVCAFVYAHANCWFSREMAHIFGHVAIYHHNKISL